jgi:protease YdgD
VAIAGVESGSAAQNVVSGSLQLSIRPPIEATRDWALVRLASPVCKGRTLPVSTRSVPEVRALAEAGQVYQVGYHHDLPSWRLAYGAPCWMRRGETRSERETLARDFADTRDLVLHTCDTGGASSGSPLLIDTREGPEVVAINVGTYVRSRVLIENGDIVHRYKTDTIANTAVGSGAFIHYLLAFQDAEILGRKEQVRRLQSLLAERGYYRGAKDGAYGPVLRGAIESYERAEHRLVTGLASTDLLERLIAARSGSPVTIEESRIETGSVAAPRLKRPRPGGDAGRD